MKPKASLRTRVNLERKVYWSTNMEHILFPRQESEGNNIDLILDIEPQRKAGGKNPTVPGTE